MHSARNNRLVVGGCTLMTRRMNVKILLAIVTIIHCDWQIMSSIHILWHRIQSTLRTKAELIRMQSDSDVTGKQNSWCISDNITVIKNEIKWIATFPAKLNAEVQVVIYNNMHLIEQPYLLWCDLLASRILAAFVWENWGVGKLLLECWHRRDSCVCLCVYIYTCIYI